MSSKIMLTQQQPGSMMTSWWSPKKPKFNNQSLKNHEIQRFPFVLKIIYIYDFVKKITNEMMRRWSRFSIWQHIDNKTK